MLKHFILSGALIAGVSGPAVALEATDSLIQWGQELLVAQDLVKAIS